MSGMPTFLCSSCACDKPMAGSRLIDGVHWCRECGEYADALDEWAAAPPTKPDAPMPDFGDEETVEMGPGWLALLNRKAMRAGAAS